MRTHNFFGPYEELPLGVVSPIFCGMKPACVLRASWGHLGNFGPKVDRQCLLMDFSRNPSRESVGAYEKRALIFRSDSKPWCQALSTHHPLVFQAVPAIGSFVGRVTLPGAWFLPADTLYRRVHGGPFLGLSAPGLWHPVTNNSTQHFSPEGRASFGRLNKLRPAHTYSHTSCRNGAPLFRIHLNRVDDIGDQPKRSFFPLRAIRRHSFATIGGHEGTPRQAEVIQE